MADGLDLLTMQRKVFQSGLPTPAKITALAIVDHWSRSKETYPGVAQLADYTGLGPSTVKKAISALEKAGAIVVRRTFGRSNRYDLRGLMTLAPAKRASHPSRSNRATSETSPGDRPVQQVAPTKPGGSSEPSQEVAPKEPIEVTQVRNPPSRRSKNSETNPLTVPLENFYLSEYERLFGVKKESVFPHKKISSARTAFKEIAEAFKNDLNQAQSFITKGLTIKFPSQREPWSLVKNRLSILGATDEQSGVYLKKHQPQPGGFASNVKGTGDFLVGTGKG